MLLASDSDVIEAVVTRGVRLEKPGNCPDAVHRDLLQPAGRPACSARPLPPSSPLIRRLQQDVLVATHRAAAQRDAAV
jgi:hypothetical protein